LNRRRHATPTPFAVSTRPCWATWAETGSFGSGSLPERCYAARQDGEVVGFAVMDQSFFRQSFVELIVVHPRHQRKGIGEALLLHLEAVCPTEKLFVSTNLSNKQMQRLCRRLGYMPSGMIDNLDPGDPEVIYCKKPQRS
jgi:ribosomal protein S18 acetylase RimI-like enzyme